jgi:hypothetical protein
MSTTKFNAPNKDEPWMMVNGVIMKDDSKRKSEEDLLNLKGQFEKTTLFKTWNFINSKVGEMWFFNKLLQENALKTHCLNSCFTVQSHGTHNITQKEKNCLTNCAIDTANMYEGFKKFHHYKLLNGSNDFDYKLSNTVTIEKI